MQEKKIVFVGAGAIATSLGSIIAFANKTPVVLHTIEKDVERSVNTEQINRRYFPNSRLPYLLSASTDNAVLATADVIFLAIPSSVLVDYIISLHDYIDPKAILVNLSKGFGKDNRSIVDCLQEIYTNRICTLKGPTFAWEIINRHPTGFTLGCTHSADKQLFMDLFRETPVYLDHTDDIKGMEILSILKNIYSIAMGIVDAQYNSPNLRFLLLTKAFREMKNLLQQFGGKEETLYRYCGFGDFTLTALNDLSRNRTLGLFIGKGFFTEHVSHELVLEGKTAVSVIHDIIRDKGWDPARYGIFMELHRILNREYPVAEFIEKLLKIEEP